MHFGEKTRKEKKCSNEPLVHGYILIIKKKHVARGYGNMHRMSGVLVLRLQDSYRIVKKKEKSPYVSQLMVVAMAVVRMAERSKAPDSRRSSFP